MSDGQWAILIICASEIVACFFLLGLHRDLIEWWASRKNRDPK